MGILHPPEGQAWDSEVSHTDRTKTCPGHRVLAPKLGSPAVIPWALKPYFLRVWRDFRDPAATSLHFIDEGPRVDLGWPKIAFRPKEEWSPSPGQV